MKNVNFLTHLHKKSRISLRKAAFLFFNLILGVRYARFSEC